MQTLYLVRSTQGRHIRNRTYIYIYIYMKPEISLTSEYMDVATSLLLAWISFHHIYSKIQLEKMYSRNGARDYFVFNRLPKLWKNCIYLPFLLIRVSLNMVSSVRRQTITLTKDKFS